VPSNVAKTERELILETFCVISCNFTCRVLYCEADAVVSKATADFKMYVLFLPHSLKTLFL
jgi:hypothetical protein